MLIGNYGVGNLGDEALRDYFLREFAEVQWQVVSAEPQAGELPRLPGGLRSLLRPWWKTIAGLWKADLVVLGGGSLFTDVESLYACFLWWWHVALSRLLGQPVHVAFQGYGPFRSTLGAWLGRSAIAMAEAVSVRDVESKTRIESQGMNKKVILSFDPVYKEILALNEEKMNTRIKNVYVIIPRRNPTKAFWAAVSNLQTDRYDAMHILSLQPDDVVEQRTCAAIAKVLPTAHIIRIRSLLELVSACKDVSGILTQRYHGALAGLALGLAVDIIPQRPNDKLAALSIENRSEWLTRIDAGEAVLREAFHDQTSRLH